MLDFILRPWHLLVLFLASHLNQEQQRIIEYLQAENQVLWEKLGKKRILLNNEQRRRLFLRLKSTEILPGIPASCLADERTWMWAEFFTLHPKVVGSNPTPAIRCSHPEKGLWRFRFLRTADLHRTRQPALAPPAIQRRQGARMGRSRRALA